MTLTHLKEVVLEEVPHGLVRGDVPPGVKVEVEDVEPGHQHQSAQLGLVANGDQNHQHGAHQVLDNLHTTQHTYSNRSRSLTIQCSQN